MLPGSQPERRINCWVASTNRLNEYATGGNIFTEKTTTSRTSVNFRRRRRHTLLPSLPSLEQTRRENAILIGAFVLIVLAAFLVGSFLAWWVL